MFHVYETIVPVTYKAMKARKCAKLTPFIAAIGNISYSIRSIKTVTKLFIH